MKRYALEIYLPDNPGTDLACRIDSDDPFLQGQRPLKRCSVKDFQQEVLAPPTTAALHGDALAAGVPLQ